MHITKIPNYLMKKKVVDSFVEYVSVIVPFKTQKLLDNLKLNVYDTHDRVIRRLLGENVQAPIINVNKALIDTNINLSMCETMAHSVVNGEITLDEVYVSLKEKNIPYSIKFVKYYIKQLTLKDTDAVYIRMSIVTQGLLQSQNINNNSVGEIIEKLLNEQLPQNKGE
jgi:hypothetical protein